MTKQNKIYWLFGITILLSLVITALYFIKFGDGTLSENKSEWGTFGDYIGGILNPLIGLATLVVTFYIAYTFNNYEKSRDDQSKREAAVKSYLELYQYFVGQEFRQKRQIAWNVIRRAIEIPEYADFVVGESFVSRYESRPKRAVIFEKFKGIYKDSNLKQKQFLHKESEDRHKLDAVVNFFQLLSVTEMPKDNHTVCDFYYDSWRPILLWYGIKLDKAYLSSEINKQFSNPPHLIKTIETLDKKFYHPINKICHSASDIEKHPILLHYLKKESDTD